MVLLQIVLYANHVFFLHTSCCNLDHVKVFEPSRAFIIILVSEYIVVVIWPEYLYSPY